MLDISGFKYFLKEAFPQFMKTDLYFQAAA